MHKVDLWVWTDGRAPGEDIKYYAYCLAMPWKGKVVQRTGDGQIKASWNRATLTAIAEALERFGMNCEVIIHSENRWVLNMIDNYLSIWEAADFWKNPKEKVANEAEWRRIAKARHSLLLTMDPVGFDRSKELMNRALAQDWREDEG